MGLWHQNTQSNRKNCGQSDEKINMEQRWHRNGTIEKTFIFISHIIVASILQPLLPNNLMGFLKTMETIQEREREGDRERKIIMLLKFYCRTFCLAGRHHSCVVIL